MVCYDDDGVREVKPISKLQPINGNFEALSSGSKVMAQYKKMGSYVATVESIVFAEKVIKSRQIVPASEFVIFMRAEGNKSRYGS